MHETNGVEFATARPPNSVSQQPNTRKGATAGLNRSDEPLEGVVTSPKGFLSDKDSGGMFYVIRLD
jgi:hypothetical protein